MYQVRYYIIRHLPDSLGRSRQSTVNAREVTVGSVTSKTKTAITNLRRSRCCFRDQHMQQRVARLISLPCVERLAGRNTSQHCRLDSSSFRCWGPVATCHSLLFECTFCDEQADTSAPDPMHPALVPMQHQCTAVTRETDMNQLYPFPCPFSWPAFLRA